MPELNEPHLRGGAAQLSLLILAVDRWAVTFSTFGLRPYPVPSSLY